MRPLNCAYPVKRTFTRGNYPERADLIDSTIGEDSPFDRSFGYYAHGVGPENGRPAGWLARKTGAGQWGKYALCSRLVSRSSRPGDRQVRRRTAEGPDLHRSPDSPRDGGPPHARKPSGGDARRSRNSGVDGASHRPAVQNRVVLPGHQQPDRDRHFIGMAGAPRDNALQFIFRLRRCR